MAVGNSSRSLGSDTDRDRVLVLDPNGYDKVEVKAFEGYERQERSVGAGLVV